MDEIFPVLNVCRSVSYFTILFVDLMKIVHVWSSNTFPSWHLCVPRLFSLFIYDKGDILKKLLNTFCLWYVCFVYYLYICTFQVNLLDLSKQFDCFVNQAWKIESLIWNILDIVLFGAPYIMVFYCDLLCCLVFIIISQLN